MQGMEQLNCTLSQIQQYIVNIASFRNIISVRSIEEYPI
jgi:hypothetical protein